MTIHVWDFDSDNGTLGHMSTFSREAEPGREAFETQQIVEGFEVWDKMQRLQAIMKDPDVRKGMVALC